MASIFRQYGIEIVSLCSALVIWQLAADYVVKNPTFLPSVTDVFTSFCRLRGDLIYDAEISLLHFGIGVVAGMCVAIPLGIGMGWFPLTNRIFNPIIEILRPIPPLAWIPFAIIWLGLTHAAAGSIVFIGTVFPILINTYTGFRNVPKVLIETAMVLGCTRSRDLIRKVAFPSAVPDIVTGIRVGMGVGWMCVVAAEMFGASTSGIGYKIQFWGNLQRMDHVMVYMLLLGFIALIIDSLFRYFVEQRLSGWRKGIVA